MAGQTVVVTDSTACLPPERAADAGITVVPLQVVIGAQSYTEGTPQARAALMDALRKHQPATTSRPSPEQFAAQYRELAEAGAGGIVSVHLSGELSATHESAVLAAAHSPIPVEVVDSRSVGMGLGYAALAAARAAAQGDSPAACAAAAGKRATMTSAFFYVDTLEYLRRGGRIGSARAFVGSALAVKPLLHLVDGRVEPLEKVRTAARAIARLEQVALERAGSDLVDVAVHHLGSVPRAELLAERLRAQLPCLSDATGSYRVGSRNAAGAANRAGAAGFADFPAAAVALEEQPGELTVSEVGAVLGAHAGPGLLAVIVSPRLP
jgi:DegV family protein with EDD domain